MLAVKNSQIIRQKCLKPEIHQLRVHRVCSVLNLSLSAGVLQKSRVFRLIPKVTQLVLTRKHDIENV